MRSTTSAVTRPDQTPRRRPNDSRSDSHGAEVSLLRLYVLRLGYLVIAVGLALMKWPLFINHAGPGR